MSRLHQVNTSLMAANDGVSVGGCRTREIKPTTTAPVEAPRKNYGFFIACGTSAAVVIAIASLIWIAL